MYRFRAYCEFAVIHCYTASKIDTCNLLGYIIAMIKSFLHKGLQKFYLKGTTAGIQKNHENKLRLILTNLDQSEIPDDMDLPGLFMHRLKGNKKDIWSVRVSGNWRITYRFVGKDVELVNYEDYH